MYIWRIVYFPQSGERHSPHDYIASLSNKTEQAQIMRRLDVIRKTEIVDWPPGWVHKIVDDIFQLTAGNHRIMYFLDDRTIIVVHACKKVAWKTRSKDKKRAILHRGRYLSQKKEVK